MKLYIQGMICLCCEKVVEMELSKMNLHHTNLELGEVHLVEPITIEQRIDLKKILHEYGLELMDDKK